MNLTPEVQKKFKRLSIATDKLIQRVLSGKLRPGRGECIGHGGRPVCVFGHLLVSAHLRPAGFNRVGGNEQAMNLIFDNIGGFENGLADAIDHVEVTNDDEAFRGRQRAKEIAAALKVLKKEFDKLSKKL